MIHQRAFQPTTAPANTDTVGTLSSRWTLLWVSCTTPAARPTTTSRPRVIAIPKRLRRTASMDQAISWPTAVEKNNHSTITVWASKSLPGT